MPIYLAWSAETISSTLRLCLTRNPPKSSWTPRSLTLLEEFPLYTTRRLNIPFYGFYHCRFLKTFYRELGTRDPPHLPPWASPLPLGTLCPAHFQPHLQLVHKSEQEHRLENIKPDQIFAPVRVSINIYFYYLTVLRSANIACPETT